MNFLKTIEALYLGIFALIFLSYTAFFPGLGLETLPGEHRSQAISPDLQAYLGSRPVGIHPEAEDDVFNHLSQTLDMTNLEKWKFIAVDYLSNQIKHIRIYPLGDSLQMQWIPQRQPLRCFPTPIKNSINIRGVCKS